MPVHSANPSCKSLLEGSDNGVTVKLSQPSEFGTFWIRYVLICKVDFYCKVLIAPSILLWEFYAGWHSEFTILFSCSGSCESFRSAHNGHFFNDNHSNCPAICNQQDGQCTYNRNVVEYKSNVYTSSTVVTAWYDFIPFDDDFISPTKIKRTLSHVKCPILTKSEFDVCVAVHHWYNNINSQLDATIIILLMISISSTCFGR